MYKDKQYKVKKLSQIFEEIDVLANMYPDTIKIFLADGDALGIETKQLLKILSYLKASFKKLRRVSTYATAQNIINKSSEELTQLSKSKLNLIYFGIETGDNTLLLKINKGVNKEQLIESLNKASNSNIKISATIILGLGGIQNSTNHIINTADIINNTSINYLSTLQLGLEENESKKFYKKFEVFTHLTDLEILEEQKQLLKLLNPGSKIIFRSNHASNALHLSGNIPKDLNRLIYEIEFCLKEGESSLVPTQFRGF